MRYCLVAVNYPLRESSLLYSYDDSLSIVIGSLVLIPLRNRKSQGCIIELDFPESKIDFDKNSIKPIDSVIEDFSLSTHELDLFKWMSSYYHYSLGKMIFDSIPKIMKKPRPLKSYMGKQESFAFELNTDQANIYSKIMEFGINKYAKHYIHGVTGSGKTIIYTQLIKETLKQGRSALFLLPEINLTPQFVSFFETYLGVPIYVYHSGIKPSDKFGLWKLLQTDSSPKFILGVRSSIFLPIKNLGMIVVDEEHDSSFKQDDRCPYNARDVAIKVASIRNIPVLLGSATPSIENYHSFTVKNRDCYYQLRERVGDSKLPSIELIDIRSDDNKSEEKHWPLSPKSISAITDALLKKEQVLVFINRLGFANYLQCRSCGHQFICPNCSSTLKYFKKKNQLSCQFCEYKIPTPASCPECQCLTIMQKGFGTERINEILNEIFPDKVIERFDRDEIKTFDQLESKLSRFHQGEIDILVGTQMLSKGHNFKKVNLVIVLGMDSQLNFPDLRSNEKAFQQLTQISGRSGRFGDDSRVLVQTLNPDMNLFQMVQNHSFDDFYVEELDIRKACQCPPFAKMALIYVTSRFQTRAIEEVSKIKGILIQLQKRFFPEVDVLGPRPNSIEKRQNQFTWNILLKSSNINQLHNLIDNFQGNYTPPSNLSIKLDIDPQTTL